MIKIDTNSIQNWHDTNKEKTIAGRWLTIGHIEPLLKELNAFFKVTKIGESTLGKPLYKITVGKGTTKVFIWSQMHGNESTGTKAIFDLFNFLSNPNSFDELRNAIIKNCTLTFLPIVNPDGAEAYTRVNANNIDLNRDVIDKKAQETKLLLEILKEVKPHYCFNLHDQRTIFTVGDTKNSATLSFLAPSVDEERTITSGRKQTMKVIVAINNLLQQIIPNQIGRYTDEFYPTATGDNFQKMGYNTILIEAGHYKNDYDREIVRKLNFIALLEGLNFVSSKTKSDAFEPYFTIPNNTKFYYDIIYKNIFLESKGRQVDVGILFKEKLDINKVMFIPEIEQIGNLNKFNANTIVDKKGLKLKDENELQYFLKKNT